MSSSERVTVTLPCDLVEGIDRLAQNRSRFIADAVRHELARRRREGLRRSLEAPHSESTELAALGLADWAERLPPEDESDLVDLSAGQRVRWIPGQGWSEEPE